MTNGAFLNDRMGLFFKTKKDKIKRKKFSIEAKTDGIPLMSKNSGRYKKVRTLSGKGYEEISIADDVFVLLSLLAFKVENLLKLSNDASSILANFITSGKMATAIPKSNPKNNILRNIEMFFPEKNAIPNPSNINNVI